MLSDLFREQVGGLQKEVWHIPGCLQPRDDWGSDKEGRWKCLKQQGDPVEGDQGHYRAEVIHFCLKKAPMLLLFTLIT